MGILAPSPTSQSKPPAAAPPEPVPQPKDDRGPLFQPADHLFAFELGDGIRNTVPADVCPDWTRPVADLTFEMRQITIAENCRARRMASAKSPTEDASYELQCREQVGNAIRKIGDTENPDDTFMDAWINDLGFHGWQFVWTQFLSLHNVTTHATAKFEASRRRDVPQRRVSYTVPAVCLPRKRWSARTGVECKWVQDVNEETLVDRSHWTVAGQPAPVEVADRLSMDLSFTLQELKQGDAPTIMDLVEDPDDKFAIRCMEVMFGLVSIGGRALTSSVADLAFKRAWLEDIGVRGQRLVTGTWTKMHEVDMAKIATFLDSATPLD